MYKNFRAWLCEKFGWHKEGYFLYMGSDECPFDESVCAWCDKEIYRKRSIYHDYKWKTKKE